LKREEKIMNVNPYLFFNGKCEEALEFYKSAIDAKVGMMMRFKDAPPESQASPDCAPGDNNKVMHACFNVGDSPIMVSDGMNNGAPNFDGFAISINVADGAEVDRYYNALASGGAAVQTPTETFFAKKFAMVKDKFGVHWMIIASKPM
jgi:PhnB protein